ncbi:hypothetical protein ARALYDRAFT_355242 [Arabidopsis lyrata subsp. lyrata]|uniref:ABC transmembrane type-1 domain-containing protein n=1 Tax=Arabidopsis lyrata subsp. lyrata TaxID=81972 RepID=D7MAI4_ARALL|nr:hypothetical protein ARALYDRAFT_355242 [Arabidopsis lyrata subsp. lyrata]
MEDEKSKKSRVKDEKVSFYKLFSFADRNDVVLMTVGTISAVANGLTQPLLTLLFGQLINAFGSSEIFQEVSKINEFESLTIYIDLVFAIHYCFLCYFYRGTNIQIAVKILYLAVYACVFSFLQVSCWIVTGERQSSRIRNLYLKTILRQDIEFFDTETNTGEVIGRMSGDTILIQEAMGEKVGKFIQLISTFIGGFVVAFIRGWELTLVLMACIPLIVAVGATMALTMSKMVGNRQAAYGEAGNVVEQAVGAIRTVAAFTGEKQAIEKYNKKLEIAYKTTVKQGLVSGLGLGAMLFVIFSSYGFAVWYGAKLIMEKGYNGGQVMNVIFSVLTGGMSLGETSPCLNAFASGQAATFKMFKTIKRNPKIDAYDATGTHEEMIQDPEGAYSQLVRLQEGSKEGTRIKEPESYDIDMSVGQTGSYRLSSTVSKNTMRSRLNDEHHEGSSYENKTAEKKHEKVSLRRLAHLNKAEIPVLLLGSVAAMVHGTMFPVFGYLLSSSINMFFEPADKLKKDARFWTLIYIILGLVNLVAVPIQNYFFGIAGGKLIKRIRWMTFDKVLHQEISWFDNTSNSSGAIGARLSTDASTVRSLVGDALAMIVGSITNVTAGLVIAFVANWMLALIVLAISPIIFIQGYLQTKFLSGFSEDAKMKYEEASQIANDAVSSIRTVASFCVEKKVMNLYEKKCEGPKKQGVRLGIVSGLGYGFSFFALYCINALCFFIGSLLIQHGKATFREFFIVFFALTVTAIGISQTSAMAPDMTKAKDSAASIFDILDSKPKIDSSSDEGTTLEIVKGDIEFQHVSFRYPTRPDVNIFLDLCLTIPSGKVTMS